MRTNNKSKRIQAPAAPEQRLFTLLLIETSPDEPGTSVTEFEQAVSESHARDWLAERAPAQPHAPGRANHSFCARQVDRQGQLEGCLALECGNAKGEVVEVNLGSPDCYFAFSFFDAAGEPLEPDGYYADEPPAKSERLFRLVSMTVNPCDTERVGYTEHEPVVTEEEAGRWLLKREVASACRPRCWDFARQVDHRGEIFGHALLDCDESGQIVEHDAREDF